jgi:hypothetical protein
MFLFNSLHQGSSASGSSDHLLQAKWSEVFALACLSVALLFSACQTEDDMAGYLDGVWINGYQGYITKITINTSMKTIEYEGSYEGTIENNVDFSSVNGVLIIKFTKYWEWIENDGEWISAENPNSDCIGHYGALYWKGLTANSVYMADAYEGSNHIMFNDPQDAQTNFTMDKAQDYIDWSVVGPYTK